jgi:hypothetical protein
VNPGRLQYTHDSRVRVGRGIPTLDERRVRIEKTAYVTVYVMRALLCSERLHLTYVRRLKSLAKLRERDRSAGPIARIDGLTSCAGGV